MKKFTIFAFILVIIFTLGLTGCRGESQQSKVAEKVDAQQAQYEKAQPMPFFNWSLERANLIELYKIRNQNVATHTVWRSNYGMIEGDCPSIGYGIPYDTSLTNPLAPIIADFGGTVTYSIEVVEQPEPNGVFASKNTQATWVMCACESGGIEPVYVESKVTTYPGPVHVDYKNNRVTRVGAATVRISKSTAPSVPKSVPKPDPINHNSQLNQK